MRKALLIALGGGAVVFAGATLLGGMSYADDVQFQGSDNGVSVCYKVQRKSGGGDDNNWYNTGYSRERDLQERLNLDIKFHSYLFGDRQPVYSVHGKHITREYSKGRIPRGDMETAHGTLITNRSNNDYFDQGARLGVETMGVLRGANNITFDCTAPDNVIAPEVFRCKVRQDGEKRATPAALVKVTGDRLCDVFRDRRYGY